MKHQCVLECNASFSVEAYAFLIAIVIGVFLILVSFFCCVCCCVCCCVRRRKRYEGVWLHVAEEVWSCVMWDCVERR